MINLLEPSQKKIVRKAFLMKVIKGYGSALLLLQIIVLVVSFSFYQGLGIEKNVLKTIIDVDGSTEEAKAYSTYLAKVRSSNKMADSISLENKKVTEISSIIDGCLSARPAGVSIRSFEFVSDPKQPLMIKIKGIYARRAQIATFVGNLSKEKIVKSVDSPFANLIKDQNGEFEITVNLNNQNGEK